MQTFYVELWATVLIVTHENRTQLYDHVVILCLVYSDIRRNLFTYFLVM